MYLTSPTWVQEKAGRNAIHFIMLLNCYKAGKNIFPRWKTPTIHSAHEEIHLQTYILAQDETGQRIANALIQASSVRGVKVYLLVDAYGSQNLSGAFIQNLKQAGIQFQKYGIFYSDPTAYWQKIAQKSSSCRWQISHRRQDKYQQNYNDIQGQKSMAWFRCLAPVVLYAIVFTSSVDNGGWISDSKILRKNKKTSFVSGNSSHTSEILVRVSQNDFWKEKRYGYYLSQCYTPVYVDNHHLWAGIFPGGQVHDCLKARSEEASKYVC